MAKRPVRFNRISVASMAELREGVGAPVDATIARGRDYFPSWEFVVSEQEVGGTRALLRSREGGLAWLHVDDSNDAYDATRIADEEAREVWPRLILQFTEDERARLMRHLQPAESLDEALEAALGTRRVSRSVMLSDQQADDGTVLRRCMVRNGGIIRAWVHGDNTIERAELVTGQDAWNLVKPFIDP